VLQPSVRQPSPIKQVVLRIRDPGSDFSPSRIRIFFIPDPGSASKNLSILTPQKWFLSSRKYDPGCSFRIPGFRIRILTFYPSRIPGSRGQKGRTGAAQARAPAECSSAFKY
jgi:hypothetical protein